MTTIENAYARFIKKRIPLPSEAQLCDLEQRIGVRFPDDDRQFMLQFNDGYFEVPRITPVGEGCPLEELEILFGIGAAHWAAELGRTNQLAIFDDNDPPKVVPIGCTAIGGLIVMDTAHGDGNVAIFLKQAFGDFYYLVDGIEAFMALRREPTRK